MSDASRTAHAELLAKVELFARLDRVTLARLAAYLEPMTLEDGATVCRQGDPGDALYIVTRGRFGVFASSPDGAGETRLGSLSPVEAFGEMALLTDEPRSATVRAEGSGEVLRLDRTRFLDLLRREPAVALALAATLSRRLRARDRTIVESDQAVAQIVEQGLGKLSPERRRRVLEASILDELSMLALQALFGQDAEALGRDLSDIGVGSVLSSGSVQPSAALLRILRERFEQEVGTARMQAFAQEAGLRLAEVQDWEDALGVLARGAARPAFLTVLGRALRGVPPIADERAMRWVERVTDEEAAEDPEVALARAALHEARGDPGRAARVLRRALGSALVAGDSASSQRLTAEVARLAPASRGSEAGGLGYGLRAAEVQQRRPRAGVLVGVIAAAGLTSAAIGVGSANPQAVFVLLLAAAIVLWVSEIFPDFAVSLGLEGGAQEPLVLRQNLPVAVIPLVLEEFCGARHLRKEKRHFHDSRRPSMTDPHISSVGASASALRVTLAVACNILAMEGHTDISLGHASARELGAEEYWVKAAGFGLEEVTPDDMILVDLEGNRRAGDRPAHRELPIHAEIYRMRPDVCAVVHTHPPHATALAATREPLHPVSHEGVLFPSLPRFIQTTDLIITRDQGQALAESLGPHNAVLLKNHGVVTVGGSIQEATLLGIFLEKAAMMQYLAGSFGPFEWTDPEEAAAKRERIYHPRAMQNFWEYYRRKLERERQSSS